MTKNEYLTQLKNELKKNNIVDMEEIISEYEQHFAFKLADGFTEEEIAAKLGSPHVIAAQFESEKQKRRHRSGAGVFTKIGLAFLALFEVLGFILFFAWIIGLGAASFASFATGVCLVGEISCFGLLPHMPHLSMLAFGVSFLALTVLLAMATYYCFAYLKQITKASIHWHKKVSSAATLPSLPWNPQFSNKKRRTLRTILWFSILVFGASSVLSYLVSSLQAGAFEFWHVWGWFV